VTAKLVMMLMFILIVAFFSVGALIYKKAMEKRISFKLAGLMIKCFAFGLVVSFFAIMSNEYVKQGGEWGDFAVLGKRIFVTGEFWQ